MLWSLLVKTKHNTFNNFTTLPQVLLVLPVFMVVVSLFLIVFPVQQKPLPSLLAFAGIFLGVPVYILFVMETPWQFRPKVMDRLSEKLIRWSEEWLHSESSRGTWRYFIRNLFCMCILLVVVLIYRNLISSLLHIVIILSQFFFFFINWEHAWSLII